MNPYPYLNGTDWCTDPELVMDAILSDYCFCEYSATKLYQKYIRSLPYQMMKYTDPMALADVVREDLRVLYKNHFDNVECIVEYDPDQQHGLEPESPRFHLQITLVVIDGNAQYNLTKILNIKNGKVIMIGESVL